MAAATGHERRKSSRVALTLPVQVQGFEADGGTWTEMSATQGVSRDGAAFHLEREVDPGRVLPLGLPLPKALREYDLSAASYRVFALVRNAARVNGRLRVGAMLLGKLPPRGFQERPAARFLLPGDAEAGVLDALADAAATDGAGGASRSPAASHRADAVDSVLASLLDAPQPRAERREHARVARGVDVLIQQVDEWGSVLREELTTTDDISRGGAGVPTTLGFAVGDSVLLQQAAKGFFATRAEVRALSVGPDGIGRLHLCFLDRPAPDQLLEQA
jgi:hypothetical protein